MKIVLALITFLSFFVAPQENKKDDTLDLIAARRKQVEEQTRQKAQAVEKARLEVAAHPDSAEAHFKLADALLRSWKSSAEFDEIVEEYSKAIQLKPDYADAHLGLGSIYYVWQKYDQSIEAINRAIALKPDSAEAYLALGNLYKQTDKYQKGFDALKKAISLKPDYAEAYCSLGFAHIQKKFGGGSRLPQTPEEARLAVKAFKRAIEIKPDYSDAYIGLGNAYSRLALFDESLQAFKQVIRMRPEDPYAHMGIGSVYIELANKDGAMQEYETLIRMASEFEERLKERGDAPPINPYKTCTEILLQRIKERFGNQ